MLIDDIVGIVIVIGTHYPTLLMLPVRVPLFCLLVTDSYAIWVRYVYVVTLPLLPGIADFDCSFLEHLHWQLFADS